MLTAFVRLAISSSVLLASFAGVPGSRANEPGCSLRIGVVDEAGAPAPVGVVVRVTAGERAIERDWPGGTGALVIEPVPCGTALVEAGYRKVWAPHDHVEPFTSTGIALTAGVSGSVVLEVPPLRSVRVGVHDRDGRPVPGAVLHLLPRSTLESQFGAAVIRDTGPDGTFTTAVDPREMYEIRQPRAWDANAVAATLDGRPVELPVVIAPGRHAVEVDYVVASGHWIQLSVRDASGDGIAGIGFSAAGEMHGTFAPTAADGSSAVSVERLPVEIRAIDLDGGRWVFEPESATVTEATAGETLHFLARRHEGDMFVLSVREERTGAPVSGVGLGGQTEDCPDSGFAFRERFTDADGVARIPCAPCPYWISANPPPGSRLLRRVWRGEVSCEDGLSIDLARGAVVTGSVRDRRGRPVPGLRLALGSAGARPETITDEDGRFEFAGVRTGTFEVKLVRWRALDATRGHALVRRDAPASSVDALDPSVTIDSPSDEAELELALVPGGLVCVTLADPDGNPVAVGMLDVYRPGREERVSMNAQSALVGTDEPERLCSLPLPPGGYLLRAGAGRYRNAGYVPVWWPGEEDRGLATPVEAEPGKTVEIGPMIVTPAGTLLLDVAGVERPDRDRLRVELRAAPAADASEESDDPAPAWTPVDSDRIDFPRKRGDDPDPLRVSVSAVPVGTWDARLCILPEGGDGDSEEAESPCWASGKSVDVVAGATAEAELATERPAVLPPGRESDWCPPRSAANSTCTVH